MCSMTRLQFCRVNPRLFVDRDMNKTQSFGVSPAENSKPPSGGTNSTDRCLNHVRRRAQREHKAFQRKDGHSFCCSLLQSSEYKAL